MELREVLIFGIAMLYVAYPLYFMVCKPTRMRTRMLGLALIIYGAIGLFWPEINAPLLILACSLLVSVGFGIYLDVIKESVLWLCAIAYGLAMLFWPFDLDPLWIPVAALFVVIGFDRAMQRAADKVANPQAYLLDDEEEDAAH